MTTVKQNEQNSTNNNILYPQIIDIQHKALYWMINRLISKDGWYVEKSIRIVLHHHIIQCVNATPCQSGRVIAFNSRLDPGDGEIEVKKAPENDSFLRGFF